MDFSLDNIFGLRQGKFAMMIMILISLLLISPPGIVASVSGSDSSWHLVGFSIFGGTVMSEKKNHAKKIIVEGRARWAKMSPGKMLVELLSQKEAIDNSPIFEIEDEYAKDTINDYEKIKAGWRNRKAKRRRTANGKLTDHFRSSMNRAIDQYLANDKTPKTHSHKWERAIGYPVDDLVVRIESQFTPGMHWGNHTNKGWHIDHIIPVNMFDYKSYSDTSFQTCWSLRNMRPLWSDPSLARRRKIPIPEICSTDFYRNIMDCNLTFCEDCCFGEMEVSL